MIAVLAFLGGCGFIYPLYTANDIYTDDRLPGTWMNFIKMHEEDSVATVNPTYPLHISQIGENRYLLSEQNAENLYQYYYVTFVKIKGYLFADMQFSEDGTEKKKRADHTFAKVSITADTFSISLLNDGYIEKQVKNGELKLNHFYNTSKSADNPTGEPMFMISEPTEKLQELMLSLYNNKEAFDDSWVFVKEKG